MTQRPIPPAEFVAFKAELDALFERDRRKAWQLVDWIYDLIATKNSERPPFTEIPDGLQRERFEKRGFWPIERLK